MANLTTNYLGLSLKNPLIVSSSGLTANLNRIKEAEANGAGAIVLKSIFEEQINQEAAYYQSMSTDNAEAYDYLQGYVSANSLTNHLNLIKEVKKNISIPIIVSINCFSDRKWTDFAKQFEEAGADALELNIYIFTDDRKKTADDYEKIYLNIVKKIVKNTSIPVSVKLSQNFTNIVNFVDKIKGVGAKGVVLFNRFYEPDIDINKLELKSSNVLSNPNDLRFGLRWTAIVSDQVQGIDISTSTGVHSAEACIKMLLAGATSVQLCSLLYNKGMKEIKTILEGIENWIDEKGFDNIERFRGQMNYKNINNKNIYQRSQFMKYFSNMEE